MIGSGTRQGRDEPGARARLVRRAVYVALGALVGLAAGIALSSRAPQRYESTMQMLVGPVGADRSTLDASGLLSRTYADLLTSRNAVNRAADSLGVTVEDGDVSAIADDKSRVILLVVQSDDPTTPPRLATTLAGDLIAIVEGSQQDDDALLEGRSDPGQVRVLDNATDPARELSRVPVLTLLGMVLVGAGLGLALGAIAPRSRRRPIDRPYLELIGLKVISLEQVTSLRRPSFLSRKPATPVANKRDEYELVFQQLLIGCVQQGRFRTVLFVPVTKQVEGDTAELMMLLAQAGYRLSCTVELADIDPDYPLLGDLQTFGTGVEIISPIDLNTESGLKRIARLTEMSAEKLLFLATPAVGSSVRALTGAPAADRIVLVARSGETERRDVRGLLDDLELLNVKPVLVLELGRGELIPLPDHGVQAIGLLDGVDAEASDADAAQPDDSGVEEVDFDFLDDLLTGDADDDDGDDADAEAGDADGDEFDEVGATDDDLDDAGHLADADVEDAFEGFDVLDDLLDDDLGDELDDLAVADDDLVDADDVDDPAVAEDDLVDADDVDDPAAADGDVDDLVALYGDLAALDGDIDELVALDGDLDDDVAVDDDFEDLEDDEIDEFDDLTQGADQFDDLDDLVILGGDPAVLDDPAADDDDLEDLGDDEFDEFDDLDDLVALDAVDDDDFDDDFDDDLDDQYAEVSANGEIEEGDADDGPDDGGEGTGWNGKAAKAAADKALTSMRSAGRWKR